MDNDKTVLVNYDDDASLEEAYRELGKAYYEGGFEDPLPELLPMFDKITRLRVQAGIRQSGAPDPAPAAEMEEKPVSFETEQDLYQEPLYQENVNREEIFSAAPAYEEPQQDGGVKFCTSCGAKLEDGSVFCGNCGCKVG